MHTLGTFQTIPGKVEELNVTREQRQIIYEEIIG